MNVLCLGPHRRSLEQSLRTQGDGASFTEEPLTPGSLAGAEFLISFGYRHLLSEDVLRRFPKRAVNVHISYLPWNRGADPNLWSFLEDTPKGVSIHYLSSKLDAGDILCQEKVDLGTAETLRTSYDILTQSAEKLFARHWPVIREGRAEARPQKGGSFHRTIDAEPYRHLLRAGWDTPVKELVGKALRKETA